MSPRNALVVLIKQLGLTSVTKEMVGYLIGSVSRDSSYLSLVSQDGLERKLQGLYCDCEFTACHCSLEELVSSFSGFEENYLHAVNSMDYGKYAVMNCHYASGPRVDIIEKRSLRDYLLRNTVGNDYLNPEFVSEIIENGYLDEHDSMMIDIVRKSQYMVLGELIDFICEIGNDYVSQRLGWGICQVVCIEHPSGVSPSSFNLLRSLGNLKIENKMELD